MTVLPTSPYCRQCDLYFVDAKARSEHIELSPSHPCCETCCRRFLNENSLSLHLQCAAHHLSPGKEEEEILDGDEVLLAWKGGIAPYLNIPQDDYWSSDSDADSNNSTSDSETELESNPETEDSHDRKMYWREPNRPLNPANRSLETSSIHRRFRPLVIDPESSMTAL
ncbi:hypothetical protein B0H19DRAFT_1065140 [Mycena capillaripes]|nr:hypothetical protein B0H19DRAFT_1065140 [Mycena capillaripes]